MVISLSHMNLHYTNWTNDNNSDVIFEHDCLYVVASIKKETEPYQIISYCLTEWPSKWNIQSNNLDKNFTFDQLYKQNITSQQLYLWSAPIDVIEDYQFYLNHLSISNKSSSMAKQLFYNCTSLTFGPLCQYSFDNIGSHHSSLNEMIFNFYLQNYEPDTLTCYTHLQCKRFSPLVCLDWSEICDGINDCQDGVDEESCWQLEINECSDNEYRCRNGQCIDKTFLYDGNKDFECLDRSDEIIQGKLTYDEFSGEPTFEKEDITCSWDSSVDMRFTSSCIVERDNLLKQSIFLDKPDSLSEDCWTAFKCYLRVPDGWNPICLDLCFDRTCIEVINKTCPDILNIPARPILFGHMYLAYNKEQIINHQVATPSPDYVCYNDQLCSGFHSNRTLVSLNNSICRRPEDFPLIFSSTGNGRDEWISAYVVPLYNQLYRCNTIIYNDSAICNDPKLYRCINSSKCISKHRLCDKMIDCDYEDDEQCHPSDIGTCSINGSEHLVKCKTQNICTSLPAVGNGACKCGFNEYGVCTDELFDINDRRQHISFPIICDGFTELIPILINGRNETDETECEYWQCNNTYTRCDGFWNCFNGADEVDCGSLPSLNCSHHHHICVSPDTNQFMCLPIEKANDGNINCLGATDEPKLCRSNNHLPTKKNFYCIDYNDNICIISTALCAFHQCKDGSDQQFCDNTRNPAPFVSICYDEYKTVRSNVENFFCDRQPDTEKPHFVYFSLGKVNNLAKHIKEEDIKTISQRSSIIQSTNQIYQQRCHRGLPLQVWLDKEKNLTEIACLCPPSFYGNMCQYQNQRVSLTLRFQTYSDSRRVPFAIVVSLIDDSDKRIIHSHQQFTFLYIQHCSTKFNIYLLYSSRPKRLTTQYSIHIDVYEKESLTYRGSFLIPLNFSFLPVHRLAVQLTIPRIRDGIESCSDRRCLHGQCIRYSDNRKGSTFCKCKQGWSGQDCSISHSCNCSSDLLCIGVLPSNRSLCVCPLNKFGSRCLLQNTICQSDRNSTCDNGGQCIPVDEYVTSKNRFICICRKGFRGERCEIADNKLIVSFHKHMILPQSMLVHFIEVLDNASPEKGSAFKTIPISQNSVTIYWSNPFHVAFIRLFLNDYYLIIVQKTYNLSTTITKTINPSDRCQHLSEVLNETIAKFPLLRRIKYYHLACHRQSPQLSCFYDENHFCLCNDFGQQRIANCFEFDPSIKHDCFGKSNCENGAQCLQDGLSCPQSSICVCQPCFHGIQCQFSSHGFGLSLDAILGYHIQPHINMLHQPPVVQISIALTIIISILGLINGILSIITFKNKPVHQVGCGLYLLGSSITILFTMIMFALKFWILLIAQMTYVTNQRFLQFQCITIDFFLRIGLNMDQWLNACVAVERTVTIIKGVNFDNKKSRQIAKYILLLLLLLTISTTIHDPIHRRLIDDDNDDYKEKRIWCIVTYSFGLQVYNTTINTFHFLAPFFIKLISGLIFITMTARQRKNVKKNETYRKILHEQFKKHRRLLFGPIILLILAIPRLIISFISGCMKSINNPWLFLVGYFISFIPSMLTFVIYVLPSKFYKEQFTKTLGQYWTMIRTRLHIAS